VKFLITVIPTSAMIFISKCWGGQVSDKHLTAQRDESVHCSTI